MSRDQQASIERLYKASARKEKESGAENFEIDTFRRDTQRKNVHGSNADDSILTDALEFEDRAIEEEKHSSFVHLSE